MSLIFETALLNVQIVLKINLSYFSGNSNIEIEHTRFMCCFCTFPSLHIKKNVSIANSFLLK